MRDTVRLRVAAAWLLAVPVLVEAHHPGIYDESNVVSLEGSVVTVHWVNPHVVIMLDRLVPNAAAGAGAEDAAGAAAEAAAGPGPDADPGAGPDAPAGVGPEAAAGASAAREPDRWRIEGTAANVLERWGVEPGRLTAGQVLRVRGPASRLGDNRMLAAVAELATGERIVLWPSVAARLGLAETEVAGLYPPPAAAPAEPAEAARDRGLFKVWTPRDQPQADTPEALPLTARALAAARTYDPFADDPALHCEPPGMPAMLATLYPIAFADRGERIVVRYEEWDGERTIYMRPGGGPPVQEPSPKGVSFGRWEGATLAIFTLYIDAAYFDDRGTPQSASATVLERYTPNADGTRLDWEVTVTDAATFTEPVVRRGHMTYEPGETLKPYDCTSIP